MNSVPPPIRVLSLSIVFPRPGEEAFGIFVRNRLHSLSEHAQVRVLSPVPLLDYARLRQGRSALVKAPGNRSDGRLEVQYPRWWYPPLGGTWNPVFLGLSLIPRVWRLRRDYDFDLIDAHFANPDGIAAAILGAVFDRPFLVTLRGNETMHGRYRLRRLLMRWALRRARRVVTVSERLRQYAISLGVSPNDVRTIPNGIESEIFHPRDQADSRRRLGIPPSRLVIVSTGALIERKGHHLAVRALRYLHEQGLPADLYVLGGSGREGHYEEEIRAEIARSGLAGNVHLTGRVDQLTLAHYLSAADVMCLASSREGWPNVVNEALACGCPVVATDVGAIPEMLPSDTYGLVTPYGDQAALDQALERALRRAWDRGRIAEWGALRSWGRVADEVMEEVRKAIGRTKEREENPQE